MYILFEYAKLLAIRLTFLELLSAIGYRLTCTLPLLHVMLPIAFENK